MKQTITILIMTVLLWAQAAPGVRCLHSGNVIPLMVLEHIGHCCCDMSGEAEANSSRARAVIGDSCGMSCYVAASCDYLAFSALKTIAAVNFVVLSLGFSFNSKLHPVSVPLLAAATRAPPWQGRACQICYLTNCALLI